MEKLDALESKIRKAAEALRRIREERDALDKQLRLAREEARSVVPEDDDALREEIDRLKRERAMVAKRIEGMIEIIEEVEAVTQAEGV